MNDSEKRYLEIIKNLTEIIEQQNSKYDDLVERIEAVRMEFCARINPIAKFIKNEAIGIATIEEKL